MWCQYIIWMQPQIAQKFMLKAICSKTTIIGNREIRNFDTKSSNLIFLSSLRLKTKQNNTKQNKFTQNKQTNNYKPFFADQILRWWEFTARGLLCFLCEILLILTLKWSSYFWLPLVVKGGPLWTLTHKKYFPEWTLRSNSHHW